MWLWMVMRNLSLNSKAQGNCSISCHTHSRNWSMMGDTSLGSPTRWLHLEMSWVQLDQNKASPDRLMFRITPVGELVSKWDPVSLDEDLSAKKTEGRRQFLNIFNFSESWLKDQTLCTVNPSRMAGPFHPLCGFILFWLQGQFPESKTLHYIFSRVALFGFHLILHKSSWSKKRASQAQWGRLATRIYLYDTDTDTVCITGLCDSHSLAKGKIPYVPWVLWGSCSRDPAAHRPLNTPGLYGPNRLNSEPRHWHPPLLQPVTHTHI